MGHAAAGSRDHDLGSGGRGSRPAQHKFADAKFSESKGRDWMGRSGSAYLLTGGVGSRNNRPKVNVNSPAWTAAAEFIPSFRFSSILKSNSHLTSKVQHQTVWRGSRRAAAPDTAKSRSLRHVSPRSVSHARDETRLPLVAERALVIPPFTPSPSEPVPPGCVGDDASGRAASTTTGDCI